MSDVLEDLRFPVGKFKKPIQIDAETIKKWISDIEHFPLNLSAEVHHLSEEELHYIFRPDGWNIKQLVHHVADSHMNAYIRIKLALTEDNPIIKPYLQDKWSALSDVERSPIEWSLNLLIGLHKKWVILLETLSTAELQRTFHHPETNAAVSIELAIGQYAWHCRHHLAHVKLARKHKNKFD